MRNPPAPAIRRTYSVTLMRYDPYFATHQVQAASPQEAFDQAVSAACENHTWRKHDQTCGPHALSISEIVPGFDRDQHLDIPVPEHLALTPPA